MTLPIWVGHFILVQTPRCAWCHLRNSWLMTPRRPERLESSFYAEWLYVETTCVCVFLCACEVVCCSNPLQQRVPTNSGQALHLHLFF